MFKNLIMNNLGTIQKRLRNLLLLYSVVILHYDENGLPSSCSISRRDLVVINIGRKFNRQFVRFTDYWCWHCVSGKRD